MKIAEILKNKTLYIFPSNRMINHFYYHYFKMDSDLFSIFDIKSNALDSKINSFLPNTMSFFEFLNKVTYSEKKIIPKYLRSFFIVLAIKNVQKNKNLNFLVHSNSFSGFLFSSSFLLNFYDILHLHNISINDIDEFKNFDTYEEFSIHLDTIKEIYIEYEKLLETNEFTSYANKIFFDYVKIFDVIHMDLEGFISPFEFNILKEISKIKPLFLHFKTDMYNINHFSFLNLELYENKRYILNLDSKELICKDNNNSLNIKLYSTKKSINQINLCIKLANNWINDIRNKESGENDYAVILCNSEFSKIIEIFDDRHIFNLAMGKDMKTLQEYELLSLIFNIFKYQNRFINLVQIYDLDSLINTLREIEKDVKKNKGSEEFFIKDSNECGIKDIENLINLIFKNYDEVIHKSVEILWDLNNIYHINLSFSDMFIFFMENLKVNISDIGGGKIKVIEALEARSISFKEILILDFNESFVANLESDDLFLSSKIRTSIHIPTIKDKKNLIKHHYYDIFKNTDTVHICYNSNELPSFMLNELNITNALDIDELYSYYDLSLASSLSFKKDSFSNFAHLYKSDLAYKKYISASSLKIFHECKRKFYFMHVCDMKEKVPDTILNIGSILHKALQAAYLPLLDGEIFKKNEIKKRFQDKCQKLSNGIKESFILEKIIKNIDIFFNRDEIKFNNGIKIEALEKTITANFLDFNLKCIIDRIDRKEEEIEIIDYKKSLSFSSINIRKRDIQMPFYDICLNYSNEYKNYEKSYFLYGIELNDEMQEVLMVGKEEILNGIQNIKNTLSNFGINEETNSISTCKECEFKVLCNK